MSSVKEYVKRHISGVHKGENFEIIYLGAKTHHCTICEFSSGIKDNLNKHIREVHNGKQDWICKMCGGVFTKRFSLKAHISQVHEGIKRRHKKNLHKVVPGQMNENTR